MDRMVREADWEDVDALVELRSEMFRAMGVEGVDDARWRTAAGRWFGRRIDDDEIGLIVVEVDGVVVATAMGTTREAAPAPSNPRGGDVLISNVCTLPSARGKGHGRAAFEAVLEWAEGTGAGRVELVATGDGRRMYAEAGFTAAEHPMMRRRLD